MALGRRGGAHPGQIAMPGEAEVIFIGNEGVVVSTPGGCVAIDALFGHGAKAYSFAPDAVIDAIEAARSPFDGIDVVLATHFHPDHFNPRSVGRHLRVRPKTRFISTPQACALLDRGDPAFADMAPRVTSVYPPDGKRRTLLVGGIRVDAFRLSHGRVNFGNVEQVGFLTYAGGASFLHLGDGIIDERTLDAVGVLGERIDAAFLPFWYLTHEYGKRLMEKRLHPRKVFAVHIPPPEQEAIESQIAAFMPDAVPLGRSMATYRIPPNNS